MVNRNPSILDRARGMVSDSETKPKRTNSLLEKTVGTSLRLPEIMEILEKRDAEKNRGILGIDKRALSHIGASLAQNPGDLGTALSSVSKGLSNLDTTKKQDVRDALQTALGFGQAEYQQERDEIGREHDLTKNIMSIEAQKEATAQALKNAKELEFFKHNLKKGTPKQVSEDGLYYKKELDPTALKMHYENLQEVNKGAAGSVNLIPLYEDLQAIDEELAKVGVTGGLLDEYNPVKRSDEEVRKLLAIRKPIVNRATREIEGTLKGSIKDSQIQMAIQEITDPFAPIEAKREVNKKWIDAYKELIDKAEYYNKADLSGKVATGYSYAKFQQEKRQKEKLKKLRDEYKRLLDEQE